MRRETPSGQSFRLVDRESRWPGSIKLAIRCDSEAALNALTKVFRPLNGSHEATKGFRNFQNELDSKLYKGTAD